MVNQIRKLFGGTKKAAEARTKNERIVKSAHDMYEIVSEFDKLMAIGGDTDGDAFNLKVRGDYCERAEAMVKKLVEVTDYIHGIKSNIKFDKRRVEKNIFADRDKQHEC